MSQATVLVVEDDPSIRQLLAMLLQGDLGAEVVLAENAVQALRWVPAARPDLVLVDGILPDADGALVARQLRADPTTADVPVLALTAMRRGLEPFAAVCDQVIEKPFEVEELLETARRWLATRGKGATPLTSWAEATSRALGGDDWSLFLVGAAGSLVRLRRSMLVPADHRLARPGGRLKPDRLTQEAFATGVPTFCADVPNDRRVPQEAKIAAPTVRSSLVVPLMDGERTAAVLYVRWLEPPIGGPFLARRAAQLAERWNEAAVTASP